MSQSAVDESGPIGPPVPPPRALPPPAPSSRGLHVLILLCSLGILVMSFLLEVRGDGRVFFRFAPEKVLPETCTSKVVFDFECAGCGLTRSFIHLAALRPLDSFRVHRAGWMLVLIVAFQVPYRSVRLVRPAKKLPPWSVWSLPVAIVSVFLHWLLKINGV